MTSRSKINLPTFVLPLKEYAPDVILLGLYTWDLEPFVEGVERKITLSCTECYYKPKSSWPLNQTNLKKHWVNKHESAMAQVFEEYEKQGIKSEESTSSSGVLERRDSSNLQIDSYFPREIAISETTHNNEIIYVGPEQETHTQFDPKHFELLMMEYLLAHNLPLAHIDSPSHRKLLEYARTCELDSLPPVSRHAVRLDLAALYDNESRRLKQRLSKHRGRFGLTLSEVKSTNDLIFIAMTLHFLNEESKFEKYLIGFEAFHKDVSYRDEKLYESFESALRSYSSKTKPGGFQPTKRLIEFYTFEKEITDLLTQAKYLDPENKAELGIDFFQIEDSEWEYIKVTHDILELFVEPTIELETTHRETSNITIPFVATLLKELESWKSKDLKHVSPLFSMGIDDACSTLLEHYPVRDEKIGPIKHLYLASVLDPRLKLDYFKEEGFPPAVIEAVEKYFYRIYDSYKLELRHETRLKKPRVEPSPNDSNLKNYKFFKNNGEMRHDEIKIYLTEPRAPGTCNIRDFYHARRRAFPIIHRMARDFFSIMAMTAPAESLFPQIRDIVTGDNDGLLPSMIKTLAILKSRDILPDETTNRDNSQDDTEQKKSGPKSLLLMNSNDEDLARLSQILADFAIPYND
ncbi:hypothetical protein HF325_002569 [Metschnikowia pulcherrima]|uniref:HAT C-terminal dimerisation domain-containing protein n=1 Tax=Metschnikowia pulcherrima TaxID=27326 RepID=A0A8H7GTB3_9ASCO|nr:hypothetical protein HF325_002569 [Metschnikowia pulcherrima]